MDVKNIHECEEILHNLRSVEAKHKNDVVHTCQLNISDMARDAADAIESLLGIIDQRELPYGSAQN